MHASQIVYLQRDGGAVDVQVSKGNQVDETADAASVDKEFHIAVVAEDLRP